MGFDFHPLAIEDCQQLDQRPKLEEYQDHLFLVTQGFSCPSEHLSKLTLHELHARARGVRAETASAPTTW